VVSERRFGSSASRSPVRRRGFMGIDVLAGGKEDERTDIYIFIISKDID
jgi:hypothetical protein